MDHSKLPTTVSPPTRSAPRPPSTSGRVEAVVKRLPLLNFFYFTFFLDESGDTDVVVVSLESVSNVGNTVGLVAALLYTVMTALPTGISYDELEVVDANWKGVSKAEFNAVGFDTVNRKGEWSGSTEGTGIRIGRYGCQWSAKYEDTRMSIRLADSISGTAMMLLVTMILSVVVIVSASTLTRTRHTDEDEDRGPGLPTKRSREYSIPEAALDEWWKLMRWVTLAMVLMMLVCIVTAVNVMNDLSYIKYAQPWLANRCEKAGWVEVPGSNGQLFENGTLVEYWSSFTPARLKTDSNSDPLRSYAIGYYWGVVVVLGSLAIAGYAALFAHEEPSIKEDREDRIRSRTARRNVRDQVLRFNRALTRKGPRQRHQLRIGAPAEHGISLANAQILTPDFAGDATTAPADEAPEWQRSQRSQYSLASATPPSQADNNNAPPPWTPPPRSSE